MSDYATYDHKDYDGGLNNTASPLDATRNQATVLRNWDITYQGQLTQRPGLTLSGTAIGANPITGIGAFLRTAGQDLLCSESTNVRYLNGSTWTTILNTLTAGNNLWFENVQALGKIYFCNEDNVLSSWDRATTTVNTCITALASSIPHGNVMRWHKNHLFALNNVNVSGTKYPNRVYWSAIGDPATWDTTNNYFELPGDGRSLAAMDIGNYLLLFKDRAIQYLSGWGDTDWQITTNASNVSNLAEEIGIAGPRAVTSARGDVYFIDNNGQIRKISRSDYNVVLPPVIVSKNLQATLAGVNKTQLSKAIAWANNQKLYFAFPNGTDVTNSIVCVLDLIASDRQQGAEAWTTYTGWTPAFFADYPTSVVPDLYIADATTGKVYRHLGSDDNGVAIDCRWDSNEDSFGDDDMYKRYAFGNISGQSTTGSSSTDMYASVDQAPFAKIGTLSTTASGSKLGPTGTFRLGPTGTNRLGGATKSTQKYFYDSGGGNAGGKTLKHSIRHSMVGQTAQVNTFSTHFKNRYAR